MSTEDDTNKTETTTLDETAPRAPGVTLTITGPRKDVDFLLEEMTLPLEQVGETIMKEHPDPEARKADIIACVVLLAPVGTTTGEGSLN